MIVEGVPRELAIDNGLDFLSDYYFAGTLALGISVHPCAPYTPHQKGTVERVNGIFKDVMPSICGYTLASKQLNGKPQKTYSNDSQLFSFSEFETFCRKQVLRYNTTHRSTRDNRTPLERWSADQAPSRKVSGRAIKYAVRLKKKGTVQQQGVRFQKRDYIAPELAGLFRKDVMIHYLPHDDSIIWIFRNGKYICEAVDATTVTPQEWEALKNTRNERMREGRKYLSSADVLRSENTEQQRASIREELEAARSSNEAVEPDATPAPSAMDFDLFSGGEELLQSLRNGGVIGQLQQSETLGYTKMALDYDSAS